MCTTIYAGMRASCSRVLYNSVQPSPVNAMDNFRGENKANVEEPYKNNRSPNFIWDTLFNGQMEDLNRSLLTYTQLQMLVCCQFRSQYCHQTAQRIGLDNLLRNFICKSMARIPSIPMYHRMTHTTVGGIKKRTFITPYRFQDLMMGAYILRAKCKKKILDFFICETK